MTGTWCCSMSLSGRSTPRRACSCRAGCCRCGAIFGKTILFVTHDIDEAIYLSDEIYVFTARPGRIKAHIEVTLSRPREQDAVTSAPFMDLKRQLLGLLNDEARIAEQQGSLQ